MVVLVEVSPDVVSVVAVPVVSVVDVVSSVVEVVVSSVTVDYEVPVLSVDPVEVLS